MTAFYRNLAAFVVLSVLMHLAFSGIIRPLADLAIAAAQQSGQSVPRNVYVILKDLEQELCFILMAFGIWLIAAKYWGLFTMQHLFQVDVLATMDKAHVDPREVLDELRGGLSAKDSQAPLIQVVVAALRRYRTTGDVQHTSDAVTAGIDAQGIRMEAENSMIRYLIWAIPSIGFIGTVRGIGRALADADKALAGDITSMTASLGLAFNSTLVALLISILLMFLLHQLQRMQDGLLVKIRDYCETHLINRISG